jgi:uncharacterized protein YkwD
MCHIVEPMDATEGTTTARKLVAVAALILMVGSGTAQPLTAPSSAASGVPSAAAEVPSAAGAGGVSRVLPTSRARTTAVRTTRRWSGAVNVVNRDAVNAAYWRTYAPGLKVPTGWTGDDDDCRAGSTSATSRAATQRAINFVRSLGGLYPVSFSSTLSSRSQLTALMMSANETLSHTPARTWRCYTGTGADNAGRSNLALGYPSITSAGVVGMYMGEPGANNTAVGHRRWLMNPFATAMGSGSTDKANALAVIGPTSAARPNPTWVSWPTAGYFPDTLEPEGRWSLSAGSNRVDFRYAAVHVYRNGVALSARKNVVESGYAQPTLVWQLPTEQAGSGSFKVVVTGIRLAGSTNSYTRTYYVKMFTPTP